jgi:hypothetical protein
LIVNVVFAGIEGPAASRPSPDDLCSSIEKAVARLDLIATRLERQS